MLPGIDLRTCLQYSFLASASSQEGYASLSNFLTQVSVFAQYSTMHAQKFDYSAATQINCSLLSISVNAMLIPAAFHFASNTMNETTLDEQRKAIIMMSRGVAVVLLISASHPTRVQCGWSSSLRDSLRGIHSVSVTLA